MGGRRGEGNGPVTLYQNNEPHINVISLWQEDVVFSSQTDRLNKYLSRKVWEKEKGGKSEAGRIGFHRTDCFRGILLRSADRDCACSLTVWQGDVQG